MKDDNEWLHKELDATTARLVTALAENGQLRALNANLQAEVAEDNVSFDLRWKADMRAIKRWQAAHPGKENIWPDHADLVVWLLEQLEVK